MQKTIARVTYAIVAAATALGLALSSSYINSAQAINAHFITFPSCSVGSNFVLTCTGGSVAGLGNANAAFLSADFQGTYQCQAVQGAKLAGEPAGISNSNGRTNLMTETINPVGSVSQSVTCNAALVHAQYTNIFVHFTLNGVEVTGSPLEAAAGPLNSP